MHGHIRQTAAKLQWGGYGGTFTDPGYVWNIAYCADGRISPTWNSERGEELAMSPKRGTAIRKKVKVFTAEERAAMKEYVQDRKSGKAEGDDAVLARIATLREPDRTMAKRLHAIVRASAPALEPKLWYGMPAYAKDGKVVCFFQSAQKFKTRYATFGFNDKANLDAGPMWPVAFALKELTGAVEARIAALAKQAVS